MTASDESHEYCRQVESYLCRKNDGHLIRIVGPAFDQVVGWAARGIPLNVAFRGIDRYVERYYAKGPRRRPVRIEFCEADVLDVFDDWRRAVGVHASAGHNGGENAVESPGARTGRTSLAAHLERVAARLIALRAGPDRALDEAIDEVVRVLDAARGEAKTLRGARREALLERLPALDRDLLAAMRARCDEATLQRLQEEAAAQLAPFRPRMPADAYAQALRACVDRLLREQMRLPTIAME